MLDTNVWLDFFDTDRSNSGNVLALVDYCLRNDIKLLVASTSVTDFAYIFESSAKRKLRSRGAEIDANNASIIHKSALTCINAITQSATIVASSHNDARMALKLCNVHSDYEDNVVVAAALRAKADFLVTDDEALRQHAPIAAYSAEDALKCLQALE